MFTPASEKRRSVSVLGAQVLKPSQRGGADVSGEVLVLAFSTSGFSAAFDSMTIDMLHSSNSVSAVFDMSVST